MAQTSAGKRKAKTQPQTATPRPAEREDPLLHEIHKEVADTTQQGDVQFRIAERAFHFYAEDGFQHGHDVEHWLKAERQVMSER